MLIQLMSALSVVLMYSGLICLCHDKQEVATSIDIIRESAAQIGVEVGILMDIAGPKNKSKKRFSRYEGRKRRYFDNRISKI